MTSRLKKDDASFRDPSGRVFHSSGKIYRSINNTYKEDFVLLMGSGLYKTLVEKGWLIPHKVVANSFGIKGSYKTISPKQLDFISYPYEWCFGQLKDAALLTLNIQKLSLKFGMTLKDASAFNVQFICGNPILIDTTSFVRYEEGQPWVAYRQFCEHFLMPLALMAYVDPVLSKLLPSQIDGIPLGVGVKMLPKSAFTNFGLLSHLFFHSKTNSWKKDSAKNRIKISKTSQEALISNLIKTVESIKLKKSVSVWESYYENDSYAPMAFSTKKLVVRKYLRQIKPKIVWDVGGNSGEFSVSAAKAGAGVVLLDTDHNAINNAYKNFKTKNLNILPLVIDITNPTPSIGWINLERVGFLERSKPDCILALAIVHHLVISANIPIEKVFSLFSELAGWTILEFIDTDDKKAQLLFSHRPDAPIRYSKQLFDKALFKYFEVKQENKLASSKRTLYLLKSKHGK